MRFSAILPVLSLTRLVQAKVWSYNLTVTSVWSEEDGHGRPKFAINGQSPGPLLTVREGEEMEVFVDNRLLTETTLHWHGIYQVDRPWNDGVPGVTQFSIQPRDNYTHRFTVQMQYGSYFYHGHFGPAFADGMRGPVWVIPAEGRERPYKLISDSSQEINAMRAAEEDPKHVIISDWNAEPMDILLFQFRDTGFAPWCSNSLVLNDKGRTYCHSASAIMDGDSSPGIRNNLGCLIDQTGYAYTNHLECEATYTPLEVVTGETGTWTWINFIHSGAHHEMAISIDEHEFYVVAADGEFVHPQKVRRANINLGERVSILVKLDQKPGDYGIRLSSLRREQLIEGLGILRYHSSTTASKSNKNTTVPTTKPWVYLNGSVIDPKSPVMDEMALRPFPPQPPPQTADTTLRFLVNKTGPSTWVLHSSPHQGFRQQLPPLLWSNSSRGDTSWGTDVKNRLLNGSVVDILFENARGIESMHPFHKHNQKAFVIGMGGGGFPFDTVEEALADEEYAKYFNLVDPPLRDGCRLQSGDGAWTVIRYQIVFPAVSMLHCHMIHHFASGQQVILLEGVESMAPIPEELKHRVHADFETPIRYGPLD